MTQTIFGFGEPLPPGSGFSVLTADRGNVAAIALDPSAAVVTPAAVGAVLLAAEANVRYADKAGSPTGTGSRAQPFLTIQQAITNAVAAGASMANPFLIKVGVGTFADAFLYEPGVYVIGQDMNATVISNAAAQQLSAAFSGAGSLDTGLQNCTIGANVNVDFSAVASPGAGRFFAKGCQVAANFTAVGNNTTNRLFMAGCSPFDAVRTLTTTNIASRVTGCGGTFFFNSVHTVSGGYTAGFVADFWGGSITVNGTSPTNFATWSAGHTSTTAPTFTGDRILYNPGVAAIHRIFLPVAATNTLVCGTGVSPGGIHMATNGLIAISSFNGGPMTLTWVNLAGLTAGSRIQFRGGAVGSPTTMSGLGNPTVVDGLEDVQYFADGGGVVAISWIEQIGIVTLVNGVSPVITLDQPAVPATFLPDAPHGSQATALTGHWTYAMNASTAIGELLIVNINSVGTRAAGTSNFQIESRQLAAPGVVEAGDQRTIIWRARLSRN